MIVLGLTGSIGMGKSTTAAMFAARGAAVWDADGAVHRLYASGGAGVAAIAAIAPGAVMEGAVHRPTLRELIGADPGLLARIEAAIHPLVADDRSAFLREAAARGAAVAVCDIPLLYETGADDWLDKVVVVSAPYTVQRARVLERPGMTDETFSRILAKQMPDAEKRARADYVIDTGQGLAHTEEAVARIMDELAGAADA